MRLTVVAIGGLVALAVPAAASDGSAVAEVAVEAPAAKPKKICRAGEVKSTGRIGGARVCKTAEEWAKIDSSNQASGRSVRTLKSD